MHLKVKVINNTIHLEPRIEDGEYTIQIVPVIPKTIQDLRETYFVLVDLLRNHSGYSRYELHEMFKAHSNISSTKHLTIVEWESFLIKFKWWVFSNFDIAI